MKIVASWLARPFVIRVDAYYNVVRQILIVVKNRAIQRLVNKAIVSMLLFAAKTTLLSRYALILWTVLWVLSVTVWELLVLVYNATTITPVLLVVIV